MSDVLQATHYDLFSIRRPRDGGGLVTWYTAVVYNQDGSQLEKRSGFNDMELERWLESFGFTGPSHTVFSLTGLGWLVATEGVVQTP